MAGVIYLMTNIAMPGMVKIGKTENADTLLGLNRILFAEGRHKWTVLQTSEQD
ncbi:hypothetical protein RU820_06365 [Acidithiobacillus ferrooxidans]|nr:MULTISPECIES: hypothetical protein [Acidithiobacillus]MBN6745123.1 hypothetical protein [Acidithiobacillus sp. MC2.2]MBN6747561.1 hypothetical protein [Acidithiobacillus sp. PG05]